MLNERITIAVAGVMFVALMSFLKTPKVYEAATVVTSNGHQEIVVQTDQYKSHYALGDKVSESFLVTGVYPNKYRDDFSTDFYAHFITFSPEASRLYMDTYAGNKTCPAKFLNKYAEHISLYASTAEIAETLSTWQQQGSVVSTWAVLNIRGYCVGERTKLHKNGQDITAANQRYANHSVFGKTGRDCDKIYVTGMKPTNTSVADFMGGAS